MRILIEGYKYEATKVKDVLHGIDALEGVEGYVTISYVGYFYNTLVKDCVFILPKVLLGGKDNEERVFGEYEPEEIIDLDRNVLLKEDERRFIYEFAVWIYRTIEVFKKYNPSSDIVYQKLVTQAGKGRRRQTDTFLDIILALLQFNRENQNFFFFVLRNLHSGFNKINWTRTISKSAAIVQDNRPLYLNPVNKKRRINFDEELLVIFFSILNYINDKYGFNAQINCNFNLISGKKFEVYIDKGLGRMRLLQIKYKYFSDIALELWELCFAFFDHARQVRINLNQQEYLLVKNFNLVFEAMIDELIGDNPLPDGMDKRQEDGKIVDHLFKDKSLIENKEKFTYYIGDSKYYKIGHEITSESIYKQYTYARNVIQWNLDIFNDGNYPESGIRLRDDELTEGYNIIPNFFISAKMDKSFDYSKDGVERTDRENKRHTQVHFHNRLFDRDTLLLFHYDVNFLFVVSLYARNNTLQKKGWKDKMREIFRKEIQSWLQDDFKFYAMAPHPDVKTEEYIREHFRDVIGKVYTPFEDKSILSLALENKYEEDNERLLTELRHYFYVEECKLGTDPGIVIKSAKEGRILPAITHKNGVLVLDMSSYDRLEGLQRSGKLAVQLNSNIECYEVVANIKTIGYVLFRVGEIEQYLYAVNSDCEIKGDVEVDRYRYGEFHNDIFSASPAERLYLTIDFNSNELDASRIIHIMRQTPDSDTLFWYMEMPAGSSDSYKV